MKALAKNWRKRELLQKQKQTERNGVRVRKGAERVGRRERNR